MKFSDNTYDRLKWIVTIFMPAFMTFLGVVGATCNIMYTQQILTILSAFTAFLGSLIGISTYYYNKEQGNDRT